MGTRDGWSATPGPGEARTEGTLKEAMNALRSEALLSASLEERIESLCLVLRKIMSSANPHSLEYELAQNALLRESGLGQRVKKK